MNRPRALIFDVFGTVVDWRNSIARLAGKALTDKGFDADPLAFADHWRGLYQPAMERIRSDSQDYVPLDDLHLENLTQTLKHFGAAAAFDADECRRLNRAWEQLDPWPDVVSDLIALKEKTIIAPCSNGSIALMTQLAKHAGLPWDCILGADIARDYKPKPIVYQACCNALQLEPGDVMMVAAHNDDLEAAQAAGLMTAFIPRPVEYGPNQSQDLVSWGSWDTDITRFRDLVRLL